MPRVVRKTEKIEKDDNALPERISSRELGLLLNITPSHIGQLRKRGVFPVPTPGGEYPTVRAVRAYITYLKEQTEGPADMMMGGDFSLSKERARLTKYKADVAEIERKQALGQLVSAAEIETTWRSLVGVMRTRLLAIPARAASRVTMARSIVEVAEILRKEVYEALDALSKGTVESTARAPVADNGGRGPSGDDDTEDAGAAAGIDG
jgi:phage terminase Nu1 subunit (DNA packaging protein)